jgi:endonuclease/exonuclease/phosphatase family metal-dependent hydrolase
MLKVLTRNLFLGANLMPAYRALAAPGGLATLPGIVAAIFNPGEPPGAVQQTDFATRAIGLADEIEATRPDLIGLQEAAQWRTDETVAADHLDLLEAELARRGLRYRRVAAGVNGDVALPSTAGFNVGLRDREAILARDDADVTTTNVQIAPFVNTLPIETPQGTFALARGWMSVDATVRGTAIRLISTHLEVGRPPAAAAAQLAQAGELLAGPADTSLPVVMLGDFNSRPDTPTYAALRAAGFDDAWTRANPGDDGGFTCCHRERLDDPGDTLRTRIDLILTRGAITATEAVVVGHRPADLRSGLWPSDHAGVVATLEPV